MADFQRLRRWWGGLTGLHLVNVAHLVLYMIQPGRDAGGAFAAFAAGIVLAAALVGGATIWLRPDRLLRLRQSIARWWPVIGVMALAGLFAFGLLMRVEWLYAQVGLVWAATAALAFLTVEPQGDDGWRPGHAWWVVGGSVGLAVLVLRLLALSSYPPLHTVDEPWDLGRAVSYLRTGQLSDWLMAGRDLAINRLYALLGAWLRVFGANLWAGRAFMFGLSVLVIPFTMLAARNFYGRLAAVTTGLALLASTVLAYAARIRHDIGLGLALAVSLWLYSEALQRQRIGLHALAGAAMAMGLLAHFHAPFLAAAMVIGLYGPRYVARWRQQRNWRPEAGLLAYTVGGAAMGVMLVLVVQPLPFAEGSLMTGPSLGGVTAPLVLRATAQHLANLASHSQYEFLLVLLGVGAAFWRRREPDQVLVMLFVSGHLALGLASSGENFMYYIVPLVPLYGLLVGGLFGRDGRDEAIMAARQGRRRLLVTLLFLLPGLGFTLAQPLRHVAQGRPLHRPPPPATQWVLDHVAPGATVVGEHDHFLWLTDYRFVSPQAPGFLPPEVRALYPTTLDFWDAMAVDVFLVDPARSTYPLLEPLVEAGYFAARGYEIAAQAGTVTIYQRTLPENTLKASASDR